SSSSTTFLTRRSDMDFIKLIDTDPELEKNGIWINYGTERVLMARAGGENKNSTKVLTALTAPMKRALDLGLVGEEASVAISAEVYAKTIVKGWQTLINGEWKDGINTRDLGMVPATVENVKARLMHDRDTLADLS